RRGGPEWETPLGTDQQPRRGVDAEAVRGQRGRMAVRLGFGRRHSNDVQQHVHDAAGPRTARGRDCDGVWSAFWRPRGRGGRRAGDFDTPWAGANQGAAPNQADSWAAAARSAAADVEVFHCWYANNGRGITLLRPHDVFRSP